MNYAIIEVLGKQYQVKPGDQISLDGLIGKEGETVALGKVLLVKNGAVEIGTPHLNADLKVKVVEFQKSPKIRVATYKAKSRSRKVIGHRQDQTLVEILEVAGIKTEAKATKTKKA